MVQKQRSPVWRWLKHASLVAALLGVLPAAAIGYRAYRLERNLCFPERRPAPSAASVGLAGAEDVTLTSGGVTLRGWYVPSKNGAAIAFFHGAGGNRAALAPEAHALTAQGYGALLLDGVGHGSSDGVIQWGDAERDAVTASIDWLTARPDVEAERIGALGFSLGGYVLARAAASDSRIRAVALLASPSNLFERIRDTQRRWGLFGALPGALAFVRSGTNPNAGAARDVIRGIAPRHLLLVTGDADPIVPKRMAEELFSAAREPKQLEIVAGAGHGGYMQAAGDSYRRTLVSFYDLSLGRARSVPHSNP